MKQVVFIFGNGNISFQDFQNKYVNVLDKLKEQSNLSDISFIVCDFRGVDTLIMEYLKYNSNVTLLHIGDKPRYIPDKYKTKVNDWTIINNFKSDKERDEYAIEHCTHYLAVDFNSDNNRVSGTLKNINKLKELNKQLLTYESNQTTK